MSEIRKEILEYRDSIVAVQATGCRGAGGYLDYAPVREVNVYLPVVAYEAGSPARLIKGVGRHKYYPLHCQELRNAGVTWMYDWSVTPEACGGIEAVPMITVGAV